MSVAFLVVSCDNYSDLWTPFFKTFHKYWSDCPYQLYLASNYKKYDDDKVKNISFGDDQKFSDNLINILTKIEEEYIILWFEDSLIAKKVDSKFVEKLVSDAISLKLDHLKFTVCSPLFFGKSNQLFGPIPRGVKYRSAIGMALYNKNTLNQILLPGKSAWELDKSQLPDKLDLNFNSLNSNLRFNKPFTIVNSVIKGKWLYTAPKFLKKEGFEELINGRAIQSIWSYFYIKLFLIHSEIYFLLKKYNNH